MTPSMKAKRDLWIERIKNIYGSDFSEQDFESGFDAAYDLMEAQNEKLTKERDVLREGLEEINLHDHNCGIDVGVAMLALQRAKEIREGK